MADKLPLDLTGDLPATRPTLKTLLVALAFIIALATAVYLRSTLQ